MGKMSNGNIEIEFEQKECQLSIILAPNQFDADQIKRGTSLFEQHGTLLGGVVQEINEERVVIDYSIPPEAVSLDHLDPAYDEVDRLRIAEQLILLTNWDKSNVIPFIHPENLFLSAGSLVLAHRGIIDHIEPKETNDHSFLRQYQAIVLAVVHPKYDYDQLVKGSTAVKDAFSQQVFQAGSISEVQTIVSRQYKAMLDKRNLAEKLVNKNRYRFFKWGMVILLLSSVGLGCSTFILGQEQLPQKERIISSNESFIVKDYDQATDKLKEDDPKQLPASAQYVLAASYVNLDDLTNEQKAAVQSTLSPKSTTNELLFWIYLGRGEVKEALSVAQNIGDPQLILHAYTKLYDTTKANNTMSGAKKQKQLEEYQKQINAYTKKIGGETK